MPRVTPPVVRQGVLQHEARHAVLPVPRGEGVVNLTESLFAVVVIGVDYDEGFPNQIFGR